MSNSYPNSTVNAGLFILLILSVFGASASFFAWKNKQEFARRAQEQTAK